MTLKSPVIYGQCDPRWANILLGYNSDPQFNIANYGCLITSFANYLGRTPQDINESLKANNGFINGGNFIWTKSSVLGLNQIYLSPHYDGPVTDQGIAKIKDLINQNYPLICELDFNPATEGEEMHFVLLIGYEEEKIIAIDPWTGSIINLDVYGGPKRAIIQFRAYDKKLPQIADLNLSDPLAQCLSQHEQLVGQIEKELKPQIATLEQNVTDRNHEIESLSSQLKSQTDFQIDLAEKLGSNNQQSDILGEIGRLISEEDTLQSCQRNIAQLQETINDLGSQKVSLQETIEILTNEKKNLLEGSNDLTETNKQLQKQLEETSAQYEVLFKIFGVYLCKRR